MDFAKNKASIITIIALIIVCGGSFIGVRAMSNSVSKEADVPSTYVAPDITISIPSTTEPSTNAPTVPSTSLPQVSTTAPTAPSTSSSMQSVITTFPTPSVSTTAPTTNKPVLPPPTTVPPTQRPQNSGAPTTNGALFDEGLASYMFNPDGNFYYTNSDPWQRAFGFNEYYDIGAPFLLFYYDTIRFKFSYGDQDWMIQFWKGQYGLAFIGHEIGVYTKPKDRAQEHYDAASNEDALYMSMSGCRDGEELYSRDYAKYWWCTGFVPGQLDSFSDRSELQIKCRITAKDRTMLKAFVAALKESGLESGQDFTTKGLDVFITW